jgi:hypothetical protein
MTRMTRILAVLIILHFSSLCASCSQVVGNKPQAVEDGNYGWPKVIGAPG